MESFFTDISALLEIVCNKNCIITGDFNFNMFNLESSLVRRYLNLFMSFGLAPLISHATNYTFNASTLIDQAWSNIISTDTKSYLVPPLTVSSHVPTVCYFSDPYKVVESGPRVIEKLVFNHNTLKSFYTHLYP